MRGILDNITITQAAQFLGVSASRVRDWDRAGKLRAARNPMNRYRLYEKADLEKVLLSLRASRRKGVKERKRG
jgi:excisionase family DNA binding protein